MNEILGSVRLKDKITIAVSMIALALVLVLVVALLSGITVDDHEHIYSYALDLDDDGSFNLLGECTVDNCEDPYYREDNISGVTLVSAVTPTCSSAGNKVYSFTRGSISLKYTEIIDPIAHDYVYQIYESDNVSYILGTCKNKGCTRPELDISGITDLQLIESVPGTCFTPRQDTYACVSNGEKITFVTTVQEDKPHTLCGVPANTVADEDGRFLYGTEGITVTGDAISCGEVGAGCYVCDVCKALIPVEVYKSKHNFVYDESALTPPTIASAGRALIGCTNPECDETVKVEIPQIEIGTTYVTLQSPATEQHADIYRYKFESLIYDFTVVIDFESGEKLEHEYSYDLDFVDGVLSLVGKCSQPECLAPETVDKDIEFTEVNTSTCVNLGFIIFSYVKDGQELTFSMQSPAYADHVFTYDARTAVQPDFNNPGSIELYCKTQGCDHKVTVELPRVNIGVNATVATDDPYYQILNYTYETEYNCTVNLVIIVYK